MAIEDRRARERAARRQLITATARKLAEEEGWDALARVAHAFIVFAHDNPGLDHLGPRRPVTPEHQAERVDLLVAQFPPRRRRREPDHSCRRRCHI